MRFNEELINAVNENYQSAKPFDPLGLYIDNSLDSVKIYTNNWQVCRLEELEDMIKGLKQIRASLNEVTGIEW